MSDTKSDTAALVARVRAEHHPTRAYPRHTPTGKVCIVCDGAWPCDAILLCDALEAAERLATAALGEHRITWRGHGHVDCWCGRMWDDEDVGLTSWQQWREHIAAHVREAARAPQEDTDAIL